MSLLNALWLHGSTLSDSVKSHLLTAFETSDEIYEASERQYEKCGLKEEVAKQITTIKKERDNYQKIIEYCMIQQIEVITWEETTYPLLLKEITPYPLVLFTKGKKELLNKPMIAIVGSRKCSEYGFEVAKKIGKDLAEKGVVVVSGMATGIDEAAHIGALKEGTTVAVLGTGVDVCYPAKNRKIYDAIIRDGCIVSEFMPKDSGLPYHFPRRNRIISGMSLGTVVVEASERSGSLITANLALEQNREVFAVPGNIFSLFSQGTNKLIQAGAKLVMSADDITNEFPNLFLGGVNDLVNNQSIALDKVEIMVYDCLSWQPIQLENIYSDMHKKHSELSIQTLEMILLKLEIKGLVQRLPARRYSRMK